jgi:acyl-CoA thioester hydrolase
MGFVVRRMVCEFLRPAQIDDLLVVETRFVEFAGARLELEQWIKRGSEKLFKAKVTVALVDAAGRLKRIPASMATDFGKILGRST